jgi:hypothetical protein
MDRGFPRAHGSSLRAALTASSFLIWIACEPQLQVSGRWSGKTEMIVEGETLTHELTVNLTQEAESVTGRVL